MERRDLLKAAMGAAALLLVPAAASAETPGLKRTVEIYIKGKWKKGTWEGLKYGDIFRLREPDGTLVDEGTDSEVCVSMGPPLPGPGIRCEPFTFIDQSHVLAPRLLVMKGGQPVGMVRMVDLKRGLMHRFQRQMELPLGDQPTLAPVAEVESFDYVELRPA